MHTDYFSKYHLAILLFFFILLAGGVQVWWSVPNQGNSFDSLETYSPANPTFEPPNLRMTEDHSRGDSTQLERRIASENPMIQDSPSQKSTENNRSTQALFVQYPLDEPVIQNFLNRWEDAYVQAGPHSDDFETRDPIGLDDTQLERMDTLLDAIWAGDENMMFEQLKAIKDPLELALMAEILETAAPGLYREAILETARETLKNVADEDDPYNEPYMGPVFEVMQKYGDDRVVSDLQEVPQRWQPYATIALAKMQQGKGIPALIEAVQEQGALRKRNGQQALQMLAQASLEDPAAYEVLTEKARADVIPSHVWSKIAAILVGDSQSQIQPPNSNAASGKSGSVMKPSSYSTQTFLYEDGIRQVIYLVNQSAVLSGDELEQRLLLIDQLKTQTSSSQAIEVLENAHYALLSSNY